MKIPILLLFILVCWPSLGCSPASESTDPTEEAEAGEKTQASALSTDS